jgi:hypothetical protein
MSPLRPEGPWTSPEDWTINAEDPCPHCGSVFAAVHRCAMGGRS